MKEIKAIIQNFMLDKVLDALHEIEDLPGCTVSEVRGYGRHFHKGGDERALESVTKTKLEIVVHDRQVERVLKVIRENAHTGREGDGKSLLWNVWMLCEYGPVNVVRQRFSPLTC